MDKKISIIRKGIKGISISFSVLAIIATQAIATPVDNNNPNVIEDSIPFDNVNQSGQPEDWLNRQVQLLENLGLHNGNNFTVPNGYQVGDYVFLSGTFIVNDQDQIIGIADGEFTQNLYSDEGDFSFTAYGQTDAEGNVSYDGIRQDNATDAEIGDNAKLIWRPR